MPLKVRPLILFAAHSGGVEMRACVCWEDRGPCGEGTPALNSAPPILLFKLLKNTTRLLHVLPINPNLMDETGAQRG